MILFMYTTALALYTTPTRSLLGHTSQSDWATTYYRSISVKYHFRTHNDTLLSSGIEPTVDDLVAVNLRSYLLSCTTAKFGTLSLSVFYKNTTSRYALCGHRTSNLPITIRRSNKQSYVAVIYDAKANKQRIIEIKKLIFCKSVI